MRATATPLPPRWGPTPTPRPRTPAPTLILDLPTPNPWAVPAEADFVQAQIAEMRAWMEAEDGKD